MGYKAGMVAASRYVWTPVQKYSDGEVLFLWLAAAVVAAFVVVGLIAHAGQVVRFLRRVFGEREKPRKPRGFPVVMPPARDP